MLDYEITEDEFWEMTLAEIERAVASKNRIRKFEARERATYDYIHATLIIKGVGIALGSKEDYPSIELCYPGIFDEAKKQEEIKQKQEELSVLRFKQFAQAYNKRYEIGGAKVKDE